MTREEARNDVLRASFFSTACCISPQPQRHKKERKQERKFTCVPIRRNFDSFSISPCVCVACCVCLPHHCRMVGGSPPDQTTIAFLFDKASAHNNGAKWHTSIHQGTAKIFASGVLNRHQPPSTDKQTQTAPLLLLCAWSWWWHRGPLSALSLASLPFPPLPLPLPPPSRFYCLSKQQVALSLFTLSFLYC
jgi:hypothetical protein